MYVAPAPDFDNLFASVTSEEVTSALDAARAPAGEYPHWDKLRRLDPPEGVTHERWWLGIKIARLANRRLLPLTDPARAPFSYSLPDGVLRRLHLVDQSCRGEIAMPEVVTDGDQARQHYLVNSLMEEAIRSSQLEGAATSRRVAKEMLRSGREPRDRSERMIRNNFAALAYMREEMGTRLTPGDVVELQRILTDGTLDDPDESGRLQVPAEERVVVVDRHSDKVLHRPPPAELLPERLERLCAFANGELDSTVFIHPVVRAILLHFWLAYDHPFADGNGRTARALFYWAMRTNGYWLTEYLSISRIIRDAPSQYTRSFLLTENDSGDTTYFILAQLRVIERALDEMKSYLARKVAEVREVETLMRGSDGLNPRQLGLLSDALRNPDRIYTFGGHAAIHSVTHETARNDLRTLASRALLDGRQYGRRWRFTVPVDLAERLKSAAP